MLGRVECERFILWLEQDAAGTLGLVDQMATLPNMEALMKRKRTEAMAQKVVAHMLRSVQEMAL